jgi:hypothetical protein
VQEPQQRPQRRDRHLGRAACLARAARDHERRHLRRRQPAQIQLAIANEPDQERPDGMHVALDRLGRHATLDRQIRAEALQQHLRRGHRRARRRRRRDPEAAQMPQ